MRLHAQLGVNKVVLITLTPGANTVAIRCEPYDAATGAPTGAPIETAASDSTLAGEMRKAAYGALDTRRKGT
jgi:hypothetical protein